MNVILEGFKTHLNEQDKAQRTVAAYTADVQAFMQWSETRYSEPFALTMFNRLDVADYHKASRKLDERVSAATWNRRWASLREFSQYLVRSGQMSYDATDSLRRDGSRQQVAPKDLEHKDFLKFRRVAYEDSVRTAKTASARVMALRDRAVIALMLEAGLREGEVVGLRMDDLELGERTGTVIIRSGKDAIDRVQDLNYQAVQMLKGWTSERPGNSSATDCLTRGGRILKEAVFVGKFGEPLQERGIQKMVAKYGRLAGVEATPHTLRHTAIQRARAESSDLALVSAFAGHKTLQSTRVYTLPRRQELQQLVERM